MQLWLIHCLSLLLTYLGSFCEVIDNVDINVIRNISINDSHSEYQTVVIDLYANNDTNPKTDNISIFKNLSNEEIPSFSEWTQKRLEEAKKLQNSSQISNFTGDHHNKTKHRSSHRINSNLKNYASPNCGAKVVDFNSESISPQYIITLVNDEYCLNTCKNKIWFVIELCESIQLKIFELGNFELFSSSPQQFTISISDRYKPKEWSLLGKFQAIDNHDLQEFHINSNIFAKYVKIDILSHYGSEHYCPVSLVKIFGTSEIEALKTEDGTIFLDEEDDGEDSITNESNDQIINLFGSAKQAVHSMVETVKKVFGVQNVPSANNTSSLSSNISKTEFCINPRFNLQTSNDSDTFHKTYHIFTCQTNFLFHLLQNKFILYQLNQLNTCTNYSNQALNAFFTEPVVYALCNYHYILTNRLTAINQTLLSSYANLNNITRVKHTNINIGLILSNDTCPAQNTTQIKPLDLFLAKPIQYNLASCDSVNETLIESNNVKIEPAMHQQESVFLRLSNRIRILEQNLSLSSQYLEELSQRYKKQVEDMQRHFDEIVIGFQEKIDKKHHEILTIFEKLAQNSNNIHTINEQLHNWKYIVLFYVKLIITELIVALVIILIYKRNRITHYPSTDIEIIPDKGPIINYERRNSADVIITTTTTNNNNNKTKQYKRRSSHEAIIFGPNQSIISKAAEKRRRRKLKRSVSHQNHTNGINNYNHRRVYSDHLINLGNNQEKNKSKIQNS